MMQRNPSLLYLSFHKSCTVTSMISVTVLLGGKIRKPKSCINNETDSCII